MTTDYKKVITNKYSEEKINDDIANIYSVRNRIGFAQKVILLEKMINIFNSENLLFSNFSKVLDLGCGNGYWLREFAALKGSTDGMYGIDLSSARLSYGEKINPGIKFMIGDMCNISFPDLTFDLVSAFVSLMFLIDDNSFSIAVSEIARVTKKGGYFLFYDKTSISINISRDKRGFTYSELKNKFQQYGFEVVQCRKVFKLLFISDRISTAYLGNVLPLFILLLIEKMFFLPSAYQFILFKKV